jgi:hypothetical protein
MLESVVVVAVQNIINFTNTIIIKISFWLLLS